MYFILWFAWWKWRRHPRWPQGVFRVPEATWEMALTPGKTCIKKWFSWCACLLSLLKPNSEDRFLTMGNHTTISGCTLLECLPQQIIDQMVVEFGLRLRKELVNLQKTTEVQQAQAWTNDTRRISMESLILTECEQVNWNLPKALTWPVSEPIAHCLHTSSWPGAVL